MTITVPTIFVFLVYVGMMFISAYGIWNLPKWLFRDTAETELWKLHDEIYDYQHRSVFTDGSGEIKTLLRNIDLRANLIRDITIEKLLMMRMSLKRFSTEDRAFLTEEFIDSEACSTENLSVAQTLDIYRFLDRRDKIVLRAVRFGSWLGIFTQLWPEHVVRLVDETSAYWFELTHRSKELLKEFNA